MIDLTPLSPEEIADGRRLCEAATSGPWEADQSSDREHMDVVHGHYLSGEKDHVALVGASELDQQNADSAFVAAARTLLPRALADLERMTVLCDDQGRDWAPRAGRTEIAERQRDEAVGLLREAAAGIREFNDVLRSPTVIRRLRHLLDRIDAFLAGTSQC